MRVKGQNVAFYSSSFLLTLCFLTVLIGTGLGWGAKQTGAFYAPVFAAKPTYKAKIKQGIPTNISIPSLGLAHTVQEGNYNTVNQTWTLNDTDAFYATPSVPLNNQKGTTLIYGHNTEPVFGKIPELQPGAELRVQANTGYVFIYEYSFVFDVSPDNVNIFNTENAPNVVLQTCSGNWDENRSMYNFSLKKVTSI